MIRKTAYGARQCVPATGPAPTWAELEELMRQADSAGAKALKAIAGLETKKAAR
jgi:hypothetical protein